MKITEHVSFIGIQEANRRMFDLILETDYGTGYNSYIVKGDKTAIIETVHETYAEDYIEKLEAITPIEQVDYVILNHAEPDHAGSLAALLKKNPNLQVYSTARGIKNAGEIANCAFNFHIVSEGEMLDLGQGVELEFIITPDLPWPDTMMTYFAKDKILFSCDVFGTHVCEPAVKDQYVKEISLFREERYSCFKKMFLPCRQAMKAALRKIENKPIYMICPGHGPILEEYVRETIGHYHAWATEFKLENYVAVFYASAYGYTEMMARRLAGGVRSEGIPVKIYDVTARSLESMERPLNEASGIMIGSPTIHGDAAKPIWDLISYAKTINLNSKPALAFGSYGWSGEASKNLSQRLRMLRYNVLGDGITCVLKPAAADRRRISEVSKEFAALLR